MPKLGMEEKPVNPPMSEPDIRCPQCDSVVPHGASRCIMCGSQLAGEEISEIVTQDEASPVISQDRQVLTPVPAAALLSQTELKEKRKSIALWLMAGIIIIFTAIVGFLVLRSGGSEVILALQPTFTPLPPPPSLTPTRTPEATETPLATQTPIPSPTPIPTDTPQPPRYHAVASGETLFGLSLLYRVSPDSIADSNAIPMNSPIQVGQELVIPWPTATPPLESMVLEIGEEKVIADVTDCEIITIQEGDSTYGLSAQRGVPAEAIIAVNRLTEESIQLLHPGDTLCIPRVYAGENLPPTVGPPPTVTSTAFPAGPSLLYPVNGMEVEPPEGLLRFQWVAVKDLADDEWYMVELVDLDQLDSLPFRAFTRDSSFKVPEEWRPDIPETHEMRWRVSIVKVVGKRSDGEVIYEYGGRSSEDSTFFWLGAEPTATPTLTPTPTAEPVE